MKGQENNENIEWEILKGSKKPILYCSGYRYFFNRKSTNKAGYETAYFYCSNMHTSKIKCRAKIKAVIDYIEGEPKYFPLFQGEIQDHHFQCIPNYAFVKVKKATEEIKNHVTANPNCQPTQTYNSIVKPYRDSLENECRKEFDQLMPSKHQMLPSIYKWKRSAMKSLVIFE